MPTLRIAAATALCLVLSACQPQPAPSAPDAATPARPETIAPASVLEPSADAALVLPGALAEATTVADLETKFGKANLRLTEVRETDGNVRRSLVLFPDDPTRRAYIRFHDDETMTGLASILVNDRGSLWRGKQGVRVGMSFAALRKANGKPFYFSGFDAEDRGWVRDQWSPALDDDDDRLGALDVAEGEHMYFGVDLAVRDKGAAATDTPKEDSASSDDPRYPRLGELVEVTAITAYTSLDDEWE